MPFLLDTVTISELRKKAKADPHVFAWQAAYPGLHYVSVITMNEIRYGVRRIERNDRVFAAQLKQWYREILQANDLFSILTIDLEIAEVAADLRYDHKMGYDDSLIAATAKVHHLILATRNLSDFNMTGIQVVNPWDFQAD